MDFIFDLLLPAFFGRGDADVCHSLLCFFFWIVLKDPCFVTCNHVLQEISVLLDPFQKMKTHVLPIVLLFEYVRFLGTNFAHNFFMDNSSVKILWTVMWFKFNSLAIIRTVSRRSDRTRARTISTLLSVLKLKVFQSGVHFDGFTAL